MFNRKSNFPGTVRQSSQWVMTLLWKLFWCITPCVAVAAYSVVAVIRSEPVVALYVIWGHFFKSSSHPAILEGRTMITLSCLRCDRGCYYIVYFKISPRKSSSFSRYCLWPFLWKSLSPIKHKYSCLAVTVALNVSVVCVHMLTLW